VSFLDEPTIAMDVEGRRSFWAMMRSFSQEGRTVVFATHHLDEVDAVADRIVVMRRERWWPRPPPRPSRPPYRRAASASRRRGRPRPPA